MPPQPTAPTVPPAAPATPEPPKTPPAVPDLTAVSEFVSRQLEGIKQPKAKPEETLPAKPGSPPPQEPKEPKGKGKQPPKPAAAPAAKKKPAPVTPPRPEPERLSEEKIAKAAAAGVAEVLGKRGTKDGEVELKPAPEQERRITVLKRMERLFPDKYKGVASNYLQAAQKLRDYGQRWEAEHPGETFDETAAEHEGFFAENDVSWDDEDYTEAIADIRADTRLKDANKETNEKLSSLEMKERLRESAPQINAHQVGAARTFWQRMGKDYADFVDPNGNVDKAKITALQASDPVGFDLRVRAASQLEDEVATLYRLTNGLDRYSAENPVHLALNQFAEEQERLLAAQPDAEKVDERGRIFLPAEQYYKLPERDAKTYHWTFSVADLGALRAAQIATQVEKTVAAEETRYEKWAAARGIKLPVKSPNPADGRSAEDQEEPEETDGKPLSPTGGVEPKMAAVAAAATETDPNPYSSFVARQIGKR